MSEFKSADDGKTRHAILVVDDEPLIRLSLAQHLEEQGFEARMASCADEAIAVLAATDCNINLVFSDVRMPGERDGIDLSKWVFENRPHIPVILASGHLGKNTALQDLCGAHQVGKPFDYDEVSSKIASLIISRET